MDKMKEKLKPKTKKQLSLRNFFSGKKLSYFTTFLYFTAKMTRCGHIYCWPCILHYLALGEKSWRKCPICYESVHDTDLKRYH